MALIQPRKTVRSQHPQWFPGYTHTPSPLSVAFGAGLARIEEKDGWVFVQEGNAYTAVRVVSPAEDTIQTSAKHGRSMPAPFAFEEDGFGLFQPDPNPHTWREDQPGGARTLVANDMHAALVIESSRIPHHATLENFQQDVLKNPLRLKQVIGSGFLLTYKGCGPEAKELYLNCSNNESPKIDGKSLRYDSPTFDSPWLHGDFGSGVITLTAPITGSKTVLDFNNVNKVNQEKPPKN